METVKKLTKKTTVTFILDPEIKEKLVALATADRRNMTSQVEWLILQEWGRRERERKADQY